MPDQVPDKEIEVDLKDPLKGLEGLASELGKYSPFDRLTDAAIDAMGVLPVFGPLVAGAYRQVVPRDNALYLHQFAREATRRIMALDETKIDRHTSAATSGRMTPTRSCRRS